MKGDPLRIEIKVGSIEYALTFYVTSAPRAYDYGGTYEFAETGYEPAHQAQYQVRLVGILDDGITQQIDRYKSGLHTPAPFTGRDDQEGQGGAFKWTGLVTDEDLEIEIWNRISGEGDRA